MHDFLMLYKHFSRRSLQIRSTQLGADHPDTAASLNNLAGLYESMGRYSEAEPLYGRALEIKQKVLPENHPSLKRGWDNFRYLIQQALANNSAEPSPPIPSPSSCSNR